MGNLIKWLIGLIIIGFILFKIFGIWAVVILAIIAGLFIALVISASKNDDKNPVSVSADNDGPGMSFDAVMDVGNIPMTIEYKNYNENPSKRDIEIHKIGITGKNVYLRALCRLNNEERTFKVSRIIEASSNGKKVIPMVFINEVCGKDERFYRCLLNGLSFCITGTLKIMTRRQALERIEAFGGSFHKNIRYDTQFLVAENKERKTRKLLEAKVHGVTIINEDTFIDYISHPELAHANKRVTKDQYEHYKENVENDLDVKKGML